MVGRRVGEGRPGLSRPRLTGGRARGRVLGVVPPEGVRPTSARVREAMFSMVGHDLDGLRVLDAFGGAGLLGLEAWSRGAEVTVVERDGRALRAIRANADALGAVLELVRADVLAWAGGCEAPFDLVLADPPYAEAVGPVVAALAPLVAGTLVLEQAASRPTPEVPGLVLDRRKEYGGTALLLFDRRDG